MCCSTAKNISYNRGNKLKNKHAFINIHNSCEISALTARYVFILFYAFMLNLYLLYFANLYLTCSWVFIFQWPRITNLLLKFIFRLFNLKVLCFHLFQTLQHLPDLNWKQDFLVEYLAAWINNFTITESSSPWIESLFLYFSSAIYKSSKSAFF